MNTLISKIHHADCIDFMSKMPDKCVDMTLTDIPYNEVNQESRGLRTFDKGFADTLSFGVDKFIEELIRVTRLSIYVFCGIQQISTIYTAMSSCMSVRLCHWEKTNPSPVNGDYLWLSATENCVFGKFPKATFNRRCCENIWRFPCGESKIHPTQKPMELFTYLIESSSKTGDIIFDPCAGSGTTARACIVTGRQFICVDNDSASVKLSRELVRKEISENAIELITPD